MKIEFNFGPHAGQTDHIPQNTLTDLLVKAGVLTALEVQPAKRQDPHVQIALCKTPTTGEWFIQAVDGLNPPRQVLMFAGTPRALREHDFFLNGKAHRASEELVQQYAAVRKRDYPLLRDE